MNEPPSIPLPPQGVRYPLYADEVGTLAVEPEEALPVAPLRFEEPAPPRPRRAAGTIAVAGALALLLGIALLGWRLLAVHHAHARTGAAPASAQTAGKPFVLSVTAPLTAPPGVDTQGRPVSYSPTNMLDGKASTAWRMPGDGTGTTLTFTLAHPATVTWVGLINGYAKIESGMDWYAGNRRVLEVEWTFDDGTQVKQDLRNTRDLQRISVRPERTGSVKLTLLKVSPPGKGPASRDATAVSEVRIGG